MSDNNKETKTTNTQNLEVDTEILDEQTLEQAAHEWSKDPISTTETLTLQNDETDAIVNQGSTPNKPVTLIQDPYGFNTEDVIKAQDDDEFLTENLNETPDEILADSTQDEIKTDDEDFNAENSDDTLDNLKASLQEQEAANEKEIEEIQAELEAEAQKRLADQIAEDEALEKELQNQNINDLDPEILAALPKNPETDSEGNLDLAEMESCIESLLFMSEKPLSANKLRELLGPDMPLSHFQQALTNLMSRYKAYHHGFELLEVANGFQFRTKAIRAPLAKKLSKVQTQRLSTGAMETLAIIAYKQPTLKEDIDKIRGVDSSHFIRGLLDKKMIKISGRSELPGRPMVYATTPEFLEAFGLKNLDSLPPLRELESMIPGSESKNPDDEDPRVKQMRKMVGEMNLDDSVSLLYNPKEDEQFLSDIRERVKSIEITTPTLEAQKERELARKKGIEEGHIDPQAEAFAQASESASSGETAELPLK